MHFNEIEMMRIKKIVNAFIEKRRPSPSIRSQVDLGFRFEDESIELFEIRPEWNNKEKYQNIPLAKASYVKSKKIWKVYWQRADLKWHLYDPKPEVKTVEEFIYLVDRDEHGCFFG